MARTEQGSTRHWFLLIGATSGALFVALLSLILDEKGQAAKVILDMHGADQESAFPYPFTIQNLMTMLWFMGFGDVLHRFMEARSEDRVVSMGLLPEDERSILLMENLGPIRKRLAGMRNSKDSFLASLIDECVLRFQSSQAIDQTHNVLSSVVDLRMHRVDLNYTLLRYISWLLPTIGFIGTVVGIWLTLAKLGDGGEGVNVAIGPLAGTLAMAFTTTMMALIQSAVLVGLIHAVQQREETGINRAADYCLRNLIDRLYVPESR